MDVVRFLRERGHVVILSREVMTAGAPDQLLAVLSQEESLVIITHDKDFKKYRQMVPEHLRSQFSAGSGRIQLEVEEPKALERIQQEIRQIEFAYSECVAENRPLIMNIQKVGIKMTRG